MKFRGKIIITDPCYIAKENDWGVSVDYENYKMPEDFTTYIFSDTGVGDGSWTVNIFNNVRLVNSKEEVIEFIQSIDDEDSDYLGDLYASGQIKEIGKFCADSGCTGIFYYDEVEKYNPDFFKDTRKQCYTVIDNFDGDINIIKDSNNFHIYGTGNKTFFTY